MDAFTPGYVEAPEDVFSSFRPSGHGMKIWEREAQRRAKRWVWPQYVVKPPYIEGTFEEGRFLISLLGLRPDDPELTHPRSQGARVETQDHCGPVLSLDAPAGFREDLEDLVSLHLFEGSYAG